MNERPQTENPDRFRELVRRVWRDYNYETGDDRVTIGYTYGFVMRELWGESTSREKLVVAYEFVIGGWWMFSEGWQAIRGFFYLRPGGSDR